MTDSNAKGPHYWLFKSEPTAFSIDDLWKKPKSTDHWDGVRNFQARNMLRDSVKKNDLVFFYHSNCNPPGIAGIAKVVRAAYPDPSQWALQSDYYDAKSTRENPQWFMVDVQFVEKFSNLVTLEDLKSDARLKNMVVVKPGNRLSISPVTATEWALILEKAKKSL